MGGHLLHAGRCLHFNRIVFNEETSWEIQSYIVYQVRVKVTHLAEGRVQ
jgi:hypothetical protein